MIKAPAARLREAGVLCFIDLKITCFELLDFFIFYIYTINSYTFLY